MVLVLTVVVAVMVRVVIVGIRGAVMVFMGL